MQTEMPPTADSLVVLQTKAALLDSVVEELRLYRGFCMQFDVAYGNSRLFRPLAAYDALFGEDEMPKGIQTPTHWQILWKRLPLWFADREERRTEDGRFRFPWSRYASLRMASDAGIGRKPTTPPPEGP